MGSVPAQLGLDEGVGSRTRGSSEAVLGEQRVEERTSAVVSHVRYCRAKPCSKVEGKEGWTLIVFCLDPITLPPRGSTGGSIAAAERGDEILLRAKRPP